MSLFTTIRIALRALGKNKMRAGLTVLGVVIGIAAVTTMVSIGQSAGDLVQGEFQAFGSNVIVVIPASMRQRGVHQGFGSRPTLTADDCTAISEHCDSVMAASPIVGAGGQLIYGNNNWSPREMMGVGTQYLTVRNWEIARGGFFTERDIAGAAKVCVIGHTIVAKLFQTTNPLGETIRIRNIPFEVIGVLEEKGANLVGDDQDNVVLAPYTTIRKRLRGSEFDNVDVIFASAKSPELMSEAQHEMRQLLFERHRIPPGEEADFEVKDTAEIAAFLDKVTGTMTILLASIAGISLLVGGVGIMNIMLVSVTERTREIGIRLAVGARSYDILFQFLVEATLLSAIGGAIGFALGWGASTGITMLINSMTSGTKWPIVVSFKAATIAILFSSAVGMFFGFFPALRASRMDPIEALRYE
ncbi:MAG: FtsX-like permease family protein [Planctomycetaceae bacterium]|nr:FtsX-like permease family protein [Planctomycetaceae bacterium]